MDVIQLKEGILPFHGVWHSADKAKNSDNHNMTTGQVSFA
jgi:hypothetical protein